jgi:hypothetical protein
VGWLAWRLASPVLGHQLSVIGLMTDNRQLTTPM